MTILSEMHIKYLQIYKHLKYQLDTILDNVDQQ